MKSMTVDERKLKQIFKSAIIEVLEENRGLVTEIIEEAVEDAAMTRAIKAGAKSKSVSREKIRQLLGIDQ
jgi:hypothetical protein